MILRKIRLPLLLLCLVLLPPVGISQATEEFAAKTGQECAVCHIDPAGGGELTAAGKGFALSLVANETTAASVAQKSALSHGFRLLVGYLHILFGIFWFGTILYVHLILKPGYASQGLPRGEVKLGLVSMVVMGITGSILTLYRVPSLDLLFTSRFGILLLAKIVLFLIMVVSALFAVLYLGPRLKRKQAAAAAADSGDLSLEELAGYDGKEGRKAYFVYKGEIFDATNSRMWKNGVHMGRHMAGGDLTDMLDQAPHSADKVLLLPKVGRLRSGEAPDLTPPQKLFYTMAYMNLVIVLLIILVLACWKWW